MPIERTTAEPGVKDWDANPEDGEVEDNTPYEYKGGNLLSDDTSDDVDFDDESNHPQLDVAPTKRPVVNPEVQMARDEVAALKAQLKELADWKKSITKNAIKAELENTKNARRQAFENNDYDGMEAQESALAELRAEHAKYEAPEAQAPADNQYTRYMAINREEVDVHVSRVLKSLGGIENMSEGRQKTLKSALLETVKDCVPQGYTPQEIAQEFASRVGAEVKGRASKVSTGGRPAAAATTDVETAFKRLHPDVKALWDTYERSYKGDKKAFIADYRDYKGD